MITPSLLLVLSTTTALMGVVLALAMLMVVLWQSRKQHDMRSAAVYFSCVLALCASVFLSRVMFITGRPPTFFLRTTTIAMGFTSLSLFAFIASYTQIWGRRIVRIGFALGVAARCALIPLTFMGYLFKGVRISEDGGVIYQMSGFVTVHTLLSVSFSLFALGVAFTHRAELPRAIFVGIALCALAFLNSFTPWRQYPVAVTAAALSTAFIARAILEKNVFRPLVEANEALSAARDEAEAANRAKSEFLTRMSHEFRTPLNAIIGYTELLLEEEVSSGAAPDLQRIRLSAGHLLALVNDVLDISRIEADKVELHNEHIDLSYFLGEVAATVSSLVTKGGNRISLSVPDDIGGMEVDATKLRQVLLNLIGNAAKFTSNGSITVTATREAPSAPAHAEEAPVSTRRPVHTSPDPSILIKVIDTGIGIPHDQMPRIFEEFFQVSHSSRRPSAAQGTGLGLAVTKRLCRYMGGDITVQSELSKGATFTVRLPISPPARGALRDTTSSRRAARASSR